jgi:glutathione S-transferase
VITLWQAEWCPYSSSVRERLTELGIDFVARQVAPFPEQRGEVDEIPTLELEDGTRIAGTRAVLAHLAEREPWQWEHEHRGRYEEHAEARAQDAPGRILRKAAPLPPRMRS